MNIVAFVIAAGLSYPLVKTFWKAGNFKLSAPINTIAEAGIGWVKDAPVFIVRLVALLEVLGVVGLVLGQIGGWIPGFKWSIYIAAAAAAGLALTMLAAAWLHGVRGELKYTWKMNFSLAGFAAGAAIALVVAAAFTA